jgi:glycerol-3-phosphate acyltransferase PlsY
MRRVSRLLGQTRVMDALLVAVAAFLAGAIPFSQIAARLTADVDLREVGTGTVSGTSLFRVSGFGPLAAAGVLDVAKGAVGPLLAGSGRPELGALCAGLAVTGHNWSPFLRGAGGRGVSPALGAFLVVAWPGTVVLVVGLVGGRLTRQTGLGTFLALLALVPVLAVTDGSTGVLAAVAVIVPMLAKRVLGNRPPPEASASAYAHRLVFDCDPGVPAA